MMVGVPYGSKPASPPSPRTVPSTAGSPVPSRRDNQTRHGRQVQGKTGVGSLSPVPEAGEGTVL